MPDERSARAQAEGPRHEARERALALLYEAELKSEEPAEVLEVCRQRPTPSQSELVLGVGRAQPLIDSLVADAAVGWEIERMPVVDRTILRLAT